MPFKDRTPWLEKWGRLHGAKSREDLEARITAEHAKQRSVKSVTHKTLV
jgi:hypothetical protein